MWTKKSEGLIRGILIDLDFASGPEDDTTYIPDIVPFSFSIPFLALDLLEEGRRQPHMYRHDLESFLWTFLWLILGNARVETKAFSLTWWQVGSQNMIAEAKRRFLSAPVHNDVFRVLSQTPRHNAQLVSALRKMTALCAAGHEALESNDIDRVTAGGHLTYENFMLALG